MPKHKTSTVIKDCEVDRFGYFFIVKAGAVVSNSTACGPDGSYRFLRGLDKTEGLPDYAKERGSSFRHDYEHYGINIPKEYCKPYDEE